MKTTRPLIAVVLAILLVFSAAFGQRHRHRRVYTNSEGRKVHAPVFSRKAPAGASARCRDGSYSFSQNPRGTCSHHGGVAVWF